MSLFREHAVPGIRLFRRSPSVAIPAVAILALGLGANVSIFAVAYAVLLRPLPVADQQSLVIIWERSEQQSVPVWEVSYRDFRDWEAQNLSFAHLAATGSINWSLRLMQHDGPVILPFAAVSGTFFDVLGVRPALGRSLTRTDDERSSAAVAVISHSAWRDRFGSDPGVVGRSITMDDGGGMRAFTVVGVMSREFDYPRGAAVWLPIAPTLARLSTKAGFDMLEARGLGILYVVGRLKPGVGLPRARANMDALVGRLTGTGTPGTGRSVMMTPLADYTFGQTRPALLLLLAAAGLVLLLTCANVIGLQLARLSSGRRELAVQIALGADRRHLLRQTLAEGTSLVLAGTAAAVVVAAWCVPLVAALAPDNVPRLQDVTLGTPVVSAFVVAASVMTALACGAVPAQVVLQRIRPILLGSDDVASMAATARVQSGLLVVQVALAVVLLVAATLTVRSFRSIHHVDLGFDPDDLITLDVLAPPDKYPKTETNLRFYQPLLEHVRRLPEVSAAAAIYLRPFEYGPIGSGAAVILEGQSPRDRDAWRRQPSLNAEAVTPDYFSVMRIPLLAGRTFTERDTRDSAPVVIVSHSAARRLWPDQNPIGKRLMASYDRPKGDWQTVVGVVGDVRYRELGEPTLDLYKPYLQSEDAVAHLIVNASSDASVLLERVRAGIRALEPAAVVDAMRPMRQDVDRQLAPWRFAALLFSLLAALALTVAVIGLYALLAHQMTARTREIGIRMAIGAGRAQIVRLFVSRAARILAAGIVVGCGAAVLAAGSMRALLFGVTLADLSTYAVVCGVLVTASALGAYWPISRATRVDPVLALRRE